MEENKNQQPQGLQIELKPEIGVGVYANLALITHSSSDFILDFTCMLPGMQPRRNGSGARKASPHGTERQHPEVRAELRQDQPAGGTAASHSYSVQQPGGLTDATISSPSAS